MSTDTPDRQDLLGVQCLRAVAAFLVVAYHAVDQWTNHVPGYLTEDYWPNGSAGVDIFFVISGLVMTMPVKRNTRQAHPALAFLRDRIIPLYWIITTLRIIVVLAAPGMISWTTLEPSYVLDSYVLLPVHDATGDIRRVLPVGLTLSYEMFFYILVAGSLLLRISSARICIPVLLAFVALAFVGPPNGFANTIAAEFIFGILIGNTIPRLQSLPPIIATTIGLIAFSLLMVVPIGSGLARSLTWGGLPAAFVVAAAVSIEMSLRRYLPHWLLATGNASYATYLTHSFVIPAVFLLCWRSLQLDWVGLSEMIIFSLVISAIAGQVTHLVIEQPLLLRLRTRRPVSTILVPG